MRKGRRIGVDVGTVRVGIANSDPDGLLAFPVATLPFTNASSVASSIASMAREEDAIEVIIGLPRHLNGTEGQSAAASREIAKELVLHGIQVRLMDERLTTTSAGSHLRAAGRGAKAQKSIIDQEAARIILQAALDQERSMGRPPGEAP